MYTITIVSMQMFLLIIGDPIEQVAKEISRTAILTFSSRHVHRTKNGIFPLRTSPVNVTKSAGTCGFGHIY